MHVRGAEPSRKGRGAHIPGATGDAVARGGRRPDEGEDKHGLQHHRRVATSSRLETFWGTYLDMGRFRLPQVTLRDAKADFSCREKRVLAALFLWNDHRGRTNRSAAANAAEPDAGASGTVAAVRPSRCGTR